MSSASDRHAAVIWLLASRFQQGCDNKPMVTTLGTALADLYPFARSDWDNDRAMNRAGNKVTDFIKEKINHPLTKDHVLVGDKEILAYCHMLSALASDHLDQLPEKPIERGAAWLRLNNEIARLINALDGPGSTKQAARGCQWARQIETILRGI